ncbi:hypothetical protein GCM10027289_01390 [Tsukamurella serpentis]
MRARVALSATTVAVAATVGLPAVAQAAPVDPVRAVLAAHELPMGSKDYMVAAPVTLPPAAPAPAGDSPCDRATHAVDRAAAGARAVEAEAWRGDTHFYSSVVTRPITTSYKARENVCGERSVVLTPPADLARFPVSIRRVGTQRYEGLADVRGATVSVIASSPEAKPLSTETFWEVFRAQISKVERQP